MKSSIAEDATSTLTPFNEAYHDTRRLSSPSVCLKESLLYGGLIVYPLSVKDAGTISATKVPSPGRLTLS